MILPRLFRSSRGKKQDDTTNASSAQDSSSTTDLPPRSSSFIFQTVANLFSRKTSIDDFNTSSCTDSQSATDDPYIDFSSLSDNSTASQDSFTSKFEMTPKSNSTSNLIQEANTKSSEISPDQSPHKTLRQRLRFSPKRLVDKSTSPILNYKQLDSSLAGQPQMGLLEPPIENSFKPFSKPIPLSEASSSAKNTVLKAIENKSLSNEDTKNAGQSAIDDDSKRIIELFTSLPPLKDAHISARLDLFQKKLIACQTLVDFSANGHNHRVIELKRQTLLEIIEYISISRNAINVRVFQDVIDMVSANVFRTLPKLTHVQSFYYDSEDDDQILDKSWPHLQIVYDVFLRVIVSNEITTKIAKNAIDKTFVLNLLEMFSSGDQRERDYLKTILHRIYGKIMSLRVFIRKAIGNIFANFTYETESHYGIAELLEILGSIINGFALPLKEEHKVYLEKTLTPLHKPRSFAAYHSALVHCMIQYIEKDRTLASIILTAILDYWPLTNTCKELLFLNELEEVLCLTELSELKSVIKPLARRIAQCVTSQHFQVSERILYMWNNERVMRLLTNYKEDIYPAILPSLYANSTLHWNSTVRELTCNVLKILSDHDPLLYTQCCEQGELTQEDFNILEWDVYEKSYLQL